MRPAGLHRSTQVPVISVWCNQPAPTRPLSSCSHHCRSPWDFEHRLDLILVSLDRPMTLGALWGSGNGGCKLLRQASQHLDAAMLLYLQTLECVRLVFISSPVLSYSLFAVISPTILMFYSLFALLHQFYLHRRSFIHLTGLIYLYFSPKFYISHRSSVYLTKVLFIAPKFYLSHQRRFHAVSRWHVWLWSWNKGFPTAHGSEPSPHASQRSFLKPHDFLPLISIIMGKSVWNL